MPQSFRRARVTSIGLVILPDPADDFEYPAHIDRASLDALPRTSGVYLFRDSQNTPLYIGKSINIRSRVLSHLRTPQEAGLLQHSCRVDFVRTAGEIGALLLESQLIKQWQPAYNARLKQIGHIYKIACYPEQTRPQIVAVSEIDAVDADLYGLFSSTYSAEQGLRDLIRRYRLCPALTGLEKTIHGRACFSHQLGQCLGACIGRESLPEHHARLRQALAQLQNTVWPYAGPIGIVEQDASWRQTHVVDRWCYLGSLEGRRKKLTRISGRPAVDIDTYKILVRPMLLGTLKIVPIVRHGLG
ncbi:MAG: endonuclease [Pseudomonadota bacterium]